MPNFSFLSGSNILVRGGWGGWLYSDYNASLSSNWTELDWTGTELGNSSQSSTIYRIMQLGKTYEVLTTPTILTIHRVK